MVANHFSTIYISLLFQNKIYDEDTIIDDEKHYYSDGYTSSKWISEGLCNIAKKRGISCNVYRLGLVLPSFKNYVYPSHQWFGRLIKTCLTFSMFPKEFIDQGIQVACVDDISKSIVHLIVDSSIKNRNLHLFSPKLLSYRAVFKQMQELFDCKEVELSTWLEKYKIQRAKNEIPIISVIEEIIEANNPGSFNNKFLSVKTCKLLNKGGIKYRDIDKDYINSILRSALSTTFMQ